MTNYQKFLEEERRIEEKYKRKERRLRRSMICLLIAWTILTASFVTYLICF